MVLTLKRPICTIICGIVIMTLLIFWSQNTLIWHHLETLKSVDLQNEIKLLNSTLISVVNERNRMSRKLNNKQQLIGQMECQRSERERTKGKKPNVASNGGWCQKQSTEGGGQHQTDEKLVGVLAIFLKDKQVGSFGDGPGKYKQLIQDTGKVKVFDSFDGAPYSEITSEGRVKFLDLTIPQYGLPLYDWVLSLEVAEHIPKEYEDVYMDNIVRHAKEGIILSWATPGQGGFHHINMRTSEYVKEKLLRLGFDFDQRDTYTIRTGSTIPCLKKNANVFRRIDPSTIDMNMV